MAKYISERLRRLGFSVLEEPIIPYHQTFRKPDLVAWRGDQAIVCDVAITGDGWDPDRAHQEKIRYYDCPEIRQWCRGLCEEATWQFGSATLNWRGAVSLSSAGFLRAVGFTERDILIMSLRTLSGGWLIWRMWTNYGGG